MRVVYVGQELPEAELVFSGERIAMNTCFFAGPTPRVDGVESWRPEALRILSELGYTGTVFIPEREEGGWLGDYKGQVVWEWKALGLAEKTLFWVPRDLDKMPGFTTNVEFGMLTMRYPERVVLGCPDGAAKMRYLKSIARNINTYRQAFGLPGDANKIPVAQGLKTAMEHVAGLI